MSFDSKSEEVQRAQLKAQRLVLAFSIVGHATPASKTRSVDDPSVLFLKLEGIDDTTSALGGLDSGESVSITDAASDSSGIFNALIKVGEQVSKVLRASCVRRSTTSSEADDAYIVSFSDTDGITANGDKIHLTVDGPALTSGTHNLCLEVEYVISE